MFTETTMVREWGHLCVVSRIDIIYILLFCFTRLTGACNLKLDMSLHVKWVEESAKQY